MDFHSRSSQILSSTPLEIRCLNVTPYSRPVLFWIGEIGDDFFRMGNRLGFDCRLFDKTDLSLLLHAKALILKGVSDISVHPFRFAVDYDIPTVWVHERDLPGKHTLNFNLLFVGDISLKEFYQRLCEALPL